MAHKAPRSKTAEAPEPNAAHDVQTPGPSAPSQDWLRTPATGVPWMQRYLIAREAADSDDDAVRLARVSVPIVLREAARNPEFAALRQQAIARTLTLGNEDSTRLARDGYPSLLQHAITRATSPEVRDRDQATWTRIVGETAGTLGSGSQGIVVVNTIGPLLEAIRMLAARSQPTPTAIELTPAQAFLEALPPKA